jgi:hypothetical protein
LITKLLSYNQNIEQFKFNNSNLFIFSSIKINCTFFKKITVNYLKYNKNIENYYIINKKKQKTDKLTKYIRNVEKKKKYEKIKELIKKIKKIRSVSFKRLKNININKHHNESYQYIKNTHYTRYHQYFNNIFFLLFKVKINIINFNYFLKTKIKKFNFIVRKVLIRNYFLKKTTLTYKIIKIFLSSLVYKDSNIIPIIIKNMFENVHYSKHRIYFAF